MGSMDTRRTYNPKHREPKRAWYERVTGLAKTHPRLFAMTVIGSYVSCVCDFVELAGKLVDALIYAFNLLGGLIG